VLVLIQTFSQIPYHGFTVVQAVDPTMWVVWANSQFATVLVVFFHSFLCSSGRLQVARSHRRMNRPHFAIENVFCAKDVPFGDYII